MNKKIYHPKKRIRLTLLDDASIIIRQNAYFLEYCGKRYRIAKVTTDSARYIKNMARWTLEDIQAEETLERMLQKS